MEDAVQTVMAQCELWTGIMILVIFITMTLIEDNIFSISKEWKKFLNGFINDR